MKNHWVLNMHRKLPIVFPHNLVSRLPVIDMANIAQYWSHLKDRKSPLASISPDGSHYPLWLWGDEAQFRESGEEIQLIAMGAVLDTRKHSLETCFPLSICRSETCHLVFSQQSFLFKVFNQWLIDTVVEWFWYLCPSQELKAGYPTVRAILEAVPRHD